MKDRKDGIIGTGRAILMVPGRRMTHKADDIRARRMGKAGEVHIARVLVRVRVTHKAGHIRAQRMRKVGEVRIVRVLVRVMEQWNCGFHLSEEEIHVSRSLLREKEYISVITVVRRENTKPQRRNSKGAILFFKESKNMVSINSKTWNERIEAVWI